MPPILHASLRVGARDPWLRGDAAWAEQVAMVLETRPGTLPWRPEFGCDLSSLVGQPATAARLGEAKWKIEAAVRRWVPPLKVARCVVSVVRLERAGDGGFPPAVPLAEAALLSLGAQAALEVALDLETPDGPLSLQALVET